MSGLTLAGRGVAFPSDLGLGADGPRKLAGADVWALLWGPDWRAEIARRGLDGERARLVHGVSEREWLHRPGVRPSVDRGTERLATCAARRALEASATSAGEIDLLVTATSTPDRIGASLAARLARELGVRGASFDVRAGGAGGVLAWIAAARWLQAEGRSALVVAAEAPSAYLHAGDPSNALLFGDGAGALVLRREAGADTGIAAAFSSTHALAGRPLSLPGALPPDAEACEAGAYALCAPDGPYVEGLRAVWDGLAAELGARLRALPAAPTVALGNPATRERALLLSQQLGLAPQALLHSLGSHGACGAAAPLIALAELQELAPRLVLAAVGGGVHAAGLIWHT